MAGIYIHVPFCAKACDYCNFHFSTVLTQKKKMIEAMIQEINHRLPSFQHPIETIYFGGGTPSLLNREELGGIMMAIRSHIAIEDVKEITLEVNPEDVETKNVKIWVDQGINRFSIGIQSFHKDDLIYLGRIHNHQQSKEAMAVLGESNVNVNADLIYGFEILNNEKLVANLDMLLDYKVSHISAYGLTMEPKTKYAHDVKKLLKKAPLDDRSAEQFLLIDSYLENKGFEHYEVSNYALPGSRSMHNGAYWQRSPYLGIGPGAHSFDGLRTRSWNVANNAQYLRHVLDNSMSETLSDKDIYNEKILTGLRKIEGVDMHIFSQLAAEVRDEKRRLLEEFYHKGWIKKDQKRIVTTKEGWLFSDYISSELMI